MPLRPRPLLLVALLGVLLVHLSGGRALDASEAVASLDETRLAQALEAAAGLPRLHSLLIARRDETLVERYFNGNKATKLANVKSASKSVISALVGIAIDRGFVKGVDQTIGTSFPEYLDAEGNTGKASITIEDLLTMRSGLQSTSNRNYGAWVLSKNWVRHALTRPMESEPGRAMEYSTGNTHLLSALLTKATGKGTWQFATTVLAEPLGFSLARWPQDPQGIYFGGNDMLLTPRQMLTFGNLYLRQGRRNGRQIVPADWIAQSLIPRTQSRRSGQNYGYGWWIRSHRGHRIFYAWGYGGQFIFLVPSLDMVVVTTSSSTPGARRRDHLQAIHGMVDDMLIPAAEAADRNSQ